MSPLPCLPVSPTRIVEFAFLHLLRIFACTQHLHAFIHRVVIHIPHHDELQLLVATHQRVLQGLYLPGCMHTHRRLCPTGGPVVHYHADTLSRQLSVHNQEAARQVHRIPSKGVESTNFEWVTLNCFGSYNKAQSMPRLSGPS